jgi:N-methylhydantoinase B
VLFLERALARDTGGAGRYRGGMGLDSYCVPWDTDKWDVVAFHNRLSTPASPVSGGLPGSGSAIRFVRGVGEETRRRLRSGEYPPVREYVAASENAPTRSRCAPMMPDDGYYLRATGGPGYGDPLERPVSDVAEDLRRGYVSVERARSAYGVVATENGGVDEAATEQRRLAVERERAQWKLTSERLTDQFARSRDSLPAVDVSDLEPRVLGEYLEVGGAEGYRCRRCGHRYCGAEDNWKWHARLLDRVVTEDVVQAPIKTRERGDLVFRQYACPGCLVQADTEVALTDAPPRWNFRPLAVWRAQVTADPSGS